MSKRVMILIKGYYGHGNLGDDVLLICAYNFVSRLFPESEIHIFSLGAHNDYIGRLIPGGFTIVGDENSAEYDVILHGGGGVFFDFSKGSCLHYSLNKVVKLIGYNNFTSLFGRYKKLKGDPLKHPKLRVGVGIGVGTYTSSSKRFYNDIQVLNSFDYLFLRDNRSIDLLRTLKIKKKHSKTTDLVFSPDLWLPDIEINRAKDRKIGFVLRSWEGSRNSFNNSMKDLIRVLSPKYDISIFAFEKHSDAGLISEFNQYLNVHVWDPWNEDLDSYLRLLMECGLILTTRAHGAIIGALLGTSSFCLEIEPKLRTISEMLAKSSTLVSSDISVEALSSLVDKHFGDLNQTDKLIKDDLFSNEEKIKSTLSLLKRELTSTFTSNL